MERLDLRRRDDADRAVGTELSMKWTRPAIGGVMVSTSITNGGAALTNMPTRTPSKGLGPLPGGPKPKVLSR